MENLSKKATYRSGHYGGAKSVYDDVLAAPPQFGVPSLSPRIEDYAEIFGGLRGSHRVSTSIPMLDLPAADAVEVAVSFRGSRFDYLEVFGGSEGLEFVVYEELVGRSKGGDYDSSDEAWTPAQSETMSEESEPFACTDRYQTNAESHNSSLGTTQFKVSYNKVFHTSDDDVANGMSRVTQLNEVPVYSFLVNETRPPQKVVVTNNLKHEDFSGELREGKQFKKSTSLPNKPFVTVSDISLKTRPSYLPPPSRPPPSVNSKDGDSDIQSSKMKASRSFASRETTLDDDSPLFYDVEVDASSSAAVSAAAMKDVMEKAQAKLISAKHVKERSKQAKICGESSERDLGLAENGRKHGKGLESSSLENDGNVEWKQDEEFYEVVETEDSRNLIDVIDDQSFIEHNLHNNEFRREKKESQAILHEEVVNRKMKSGSEIHEKIIVEAVQGEDSENVANVWVRESDGEKRSENDFERRDAERESYDKRLKEATEREEIEKRLKETLEREEKDKIERETQEREEKEKREIEARERDLEEKRLREAVEKEEKEKRSRLALEEKEKKQREAWEKEEKEKREKKARERELDEKRLREAIEREEKEKRSRLAFEEKEKKEREAREREEKEKKEKEARERELEEKEKRLRLALQLKEKKEREAREREEKEKRETEVREREHEENEKRMRLALEEKEKKQREAREREEKEAKEKEARLREEKEKRDKEAREREEEKRLQKILEEKEKKQKEAREREEKEKREKEDCERELEAKRLREALEQEEEENKLKIALEKQKNEKKLKLACETDKAEKRCKINISEEPNIILQKEEHKEKDSELKEDNMKRSNEAFDFEHENIDKMWEEINGLDENVAFYEAAINVDKKSCEMKKGNLSKSKDSLPRHDTVFEFEKISSKRNANSAKPNVVDYDLGDISTNTKKSQVAKGKKEEKVTSSQEVKPKMQSQNTEQKGKNLDDVLSREEKEREERISREREMENERLRKIEEEREREREREKDRMAVNMASLERAAVERANADARQRLQKANAEARLKAERAAVERATAEVRERAFQKAKAEKSAFETRERAERMRQSSLQSDSFQSSGSNNRSMNAYSSVHGGVEVESAQRCKARLERHQRTAQRAAKALEEKNQRDLLAQRELAERNRLSEGLDAEVKRWSSGKEGNLRALLSTLQYILGPDSGWQPIHLTEVITSAAVKRAYRKATLCVHPDKLQQRGASIHQKYICEKVFDLLKAAWNKFNSEER